MDNGSPWEQFALLTGKITFTILNANANKCDFSSIIILRTSVNVSVNRVFVFASWMNITIICNQLAPRKKLGDLHFCDMQNSPSDWKWLYDKSTRSNNYMGPKMQSAEGWQARPHEALRREIKFPERLSHCCANTSAQFNRLWVQGEVRSNLKKREKGEQRDKKNISQHFVDNNLAMKLKPLQAT